MIKIQDPEGFIQQKLAKKNLSPNTIRDLLMAALLIALQENEKTTSTEREQADWREAKAIEMREKASQIFAKLGAPFEYPTRKQLVGAVAALKQEYLWEQLAQTPKEAFDARYAQIVSKFPNETETGSP